MDYIEKMAKKEKPKMLLCGYTAYARTIDFKRFGEIARDVGAIAFADVSHIAGLIAGGAHPSPFPHMDVVMTTTHKTLLGARGAIIMCKEKYAKQIDRAVFPGVQGGPHNHSIAGKAVAFKEALKPEFKEFAQQVVKNAKALAESLMKNGIRVVSGGTDNHLVLADLTDTGVTGTEAASALNKAYIILNKNMVPFDKSTPFNPSGIRMGTPSITQRGFKEEECKRIGELIAKIVKNHTDEQLIKNAKEEILEMTKKFPGYE